MAIDVGATAPPRTHVLSRTDLVRYAGASGDFNPMHHDEEKAKAAGMPSVFGHGMLSMALVGRAITDWAGPGALRQFKVRFAKQTWPGDALTTAVTATAIREDGGERLADLDCALTNQDGETVVAGTATIQIESTG